jgi:hypothetical protein
MKRVSKLPYITTTISLIVVAIVVSVSLQPKKHYPIDEKILKKSNFTVLIPSEYKAVNQRTVSFNKEVGGLSYNATFNNVTYTVNEQPTPDIFSENPSVYGFKLDQMKQFQDLQTSIGKVTLTKPTEFGGQVVAVSNINGTLTFIRANQPLTEDQWKNFYNNLELIR